MISAASGQRRQILLIILIILSGTAVILHIRCLFVSTRSPDPRFQPPPRRASSVKMVPLPASPKSGRTDVIVPKAPKLPNPNRKVAATALMSQDLNARKWTLDSIRDFYFQEVMRVHTKCNRIVHVGRPGDGGWDVCMEKGYELKMGTPCFVYSFGVGNIWEFDEQMSTRYDCMVRTFDPTMRLKEHIHTPGKVHFYPIGLGGSKNSTKHTFRTRNLDSFMRQFGEREKTLDVLKIDIEYSEWESLESIIKNGLLNQVKQLLIEYHSKEQTGHVGSVADFKRYITIFQKLEAAGFRKFQTHKNGFGIGPFRNTFTSHGQRVPPSLSSQSCCHEAYYINMRFRT